MNDVKKNAVEQRRAYNMTAFLCEFAIVSLFFSGVALIAVGLWNIWPPLAMIFVGLACLYLARCVKLSAKFPERTVKK